MQKAEKAKEEHRLRYPDYVFRPARNDGTKETSKKRVCGETESGSEPHCGQLPKRATKRTRIYNPTPQSISRVASEPAMAVAGMLTSSPRMQRHTSAPCIGEAMTEHFALPTIPSTHLATTLQRPPRGTSVSRHRRSAAHPVAFNTPMTLGHTTPVDLLYSSLPPLELDPALFDPAFLYSAVQGFGTQDASFAPQASYVSVVFFYAFSRSLNLSVSSSHLSTPVISFCNPQCMVAHLPSNFMVRAHLLLSAPSS